MGGNTSDEETNPDNGNPVDGFYFVCWSGQSGRRVDG